MARKKRQHTVPRVYLRAWASKSSSPGARGKKTLPEVWISRAESVTAFRRKAIKNILWKNSIYTLPEDDPSRPVIEEALGALETSYGRIRRSLERDQHPSEEDYVLLLAFVAALHGRSPSQIESRQDFWDDIRRVSGAVERSHTGGECWSGANLPEDEKKGVRTLPMWVEVFANVLAPFGTLVRNTSSLQFITSDRPVVHTFPRGYDLPLAYLPDDWKNPEVSPTPAFLTFCPLGTELAFISSPHLIPGPMFRELDDVRACHAFNELSRLHADKTIVAASKRPYHGLETLTDFAEARRRELTAGPHLHLVTSHGRCRIPVEDISMDDGATPLQTVIRFRTTYLEDLRRIEADGAILELEFIDPGNSRSYFKGASVVTVAASRLDFCEIRSGPPDW